MPAQPPYKFTIAKNYKDLCVIVARHIVQAARAGIEARGRFTMVLAGGATPVGVYTRLADAEFQDLVDWGKVHLFWGDERFVPLDNLRSNYAMIKASLLDPMKIPSGNVHYVNTAAADAGQSAAAYARELANFFAIKPPAIPRFDLILLGLGEDGHTASLFPGAQALSEEKRLAIAVQSTGVPESRISLTLPVINNAGNIFFVVSGIAKAGILERVLSPQDIKQRLPAQQVSPVSGKLWWFVDQDAAGETFTGQEMSK